MEHLLFCESRQVNVRIIALPGEDAVVVGVEDEATEVAQFHMGLGLNAEAASHVVVAVDDAVVVALGTTEQDSVKEDALLKM